MSNPIEIMVNADGSFDLPAVHVAPYVAPVVTDPPVTTEPSPTDPPVTTDPTPTDPVTTDPAVVVDFSATVSGMQVVVWDKSTGLPYAHKGSVDWGDGKITVIYSKGSNQHTYAVAGDDTITLTHVLNGVTYTKSKPVTVPDGDPVPSDPVDEPPPDDGSDEGLDPTGPDPTVVPRAFSGAELHWRDVESTDVVDIQIDLDATADQVVFDSKGNKSVVQVPLPDDQRSLSLVAAPVGMTPLKFEDGTDHPDLAVCRYKDNVLVENPWPDTQLNYSGTLTIEVNGAQVFQQAGVKFWLRCGTTPIRDGLPQYTPTAPDLSLLPTYGNPGPLKEPTPGGTGTAGDYPRLDINGLGYSLYVAMGSTGGRRDIALIPGWDLPWALQGLYWQACRDANDHSAVWPKRIRNPATGMIIDPSEWGDATVLNAYVRKPAFMSGHVNPIAALSTCPYLPNGAHQTHFGVVPYLSTQSDFDMEEMLSWSVFDSLEGNPSYRQFGKCIATGSPRRLAWVLAQYGYCAKLLPDAHPYKSVYTKIVHDNASYWWGEQYAPGMPKNNPFGVILNIAYPDALKRARGIAPWQNHYLAGALNLLVRYGFDDYVPWRDFSAGFAVNSMAQMCYQMGTFYEMYVVNPADGVFGNTVTPANLWTTWAEVKADTLATAYAARMADQVDTPCGQMNINSLGVGLMSGATGGQQSYPAMLQQGLAAAVDAGLPNAQAMWDKLKQFGGDIDFTVSNEKNIVPEAAA